MSCSAGGLTHWDLSWAWLHSSVTVLDSSADVQERRIFMLDPMSIGSFSPKFAFFTLNLDFFLNNLQNTKTT
jgi:hypothetical protein